MQSMVSNVRSAADNYGIDSEAYMKYFYGYGDEASFLEYLHTTVENVMKEKIVVSCIAMDNDLIADNADIKAYRQKVMDKNNLENDSDVDKYYSESDLMFYATEENVLDYLMNRSVQVEATATDASEAATEE